MAKKETLNYSENQSELINIIGKSAVVVVLWKKVDNWPVEFISHNVASLVGYSSDEFLNGNVKYDEIIHPDDLQKVIAEVRLNEANGRSHFEHEPYRLITKSGKIIWVKDTTYFRKNAKNEVTHFEGTVQDITEEYKANRNLDSKRLEIKELEERYKTFANASFESLFISEKGYCIEQNDRAAKKFGYTNEEAEGMFASDIFAPESRDIVAKNVINGYTKPYDVIALKKDGSTFHAEVHGKNIIVGNKKLRITAIRDISIRKESEIKILEQERNLRDSNKLLKDKTEFLEIVNDFARKIENVTTLSDIVWDVVENVIEKFHFDDCEIFLFDKRKENLIQVANYQRNTEKNRTIKNPMSIKAGTGIVGATAALGKPIIVKDTSKEPRYIVNDRSCLSEITIPIIADGEVLGVIDSENPELNYYSSNHVIKLTTIANITASRIKSAMAAKALEDSNKILSSKTAFLETVNNFSNDLQDVKTIDRLVWNLVNVLMNKFHFEDCVVYLLDKEGENLVQVAANGKKLNPDVKISSPLVLKMGEGIVGAAAKSKKSINVKDTTIDSRYVVDDVDRLSELSVPIVTNGELLGVIDSEHPEKNYFTQDHVDVLTTIANIAASRIKNLGSEKEIKESELKHRLIFEHAKDAILLIKDGVFVDCNSMTIAMFGCENQNQIVGYSPIKFSPDFQYDGLESGVKAKDKIALAINGEPQTFDWVHKKLNGEPFDAEVSLNSFNFKNHVFIQAVVRDVTDKKRLNESLFRSEALYRNLIEITESVAWEMDAATWKFTFMSPGIEKLSGFKTSDWKDFDFWTNQIHAEDRKSAVDYCKVSTTKGLNHSFEYRLVKADGSIAWIKDVVSIIKENGSVSTLRGYFIDITAQKKAELIKAEYTLKLQEKVKELFASREEFKSLFNESMVSLWEADYTVAFQILTDLKNSGVTNVEKYFSDNEGFVFECLEGVKIIRANKASSKLFKATSIDSLVESFDALVTDKNLGHFIDAFIRVFKGENEFTIQTTFNDFNNETVHGVVKYFFIKDKDSNKVKANISIINVTDRVDVENELSSQNDKLIDISNKLSIKNSLLEVSQNRFENLFEKSPVSLWEEDISELITLIETTKVKQKDIIDYIENEPNFILECLKKVRVVNINKESLVMFGVKTKEELIGNMARSFNEKSLENFKSEVIKIAKGDTKFRSETEFVKSNGDIINAIVNVEVITDVGHAIVSIIDVTALKKAESELIVAKENAEESDRLKSEFLNNISHEIRTPLNGIIGFSSFLSDPDMTYELRSQYVKIIQNSGNQLIRIIDEILEISKIDSHPEQPRLIGASLNDILFELTAIFDLSAKEKGLKLNVNYGLPHAESHILTDITKLNKVLSNVLQNALKFTYQGTINLGYGIIDNQIKLYVEDTGIGIEDSKLERIFERFAQEDSTIAANYGGLGLGLAIVKEHLDVLDGSISVESKKGEGSKFLISIPYLRSELKSTEKEMIQSDINSKIVLMVEDDAVNALLMKRFLENSKMFTEVIHAVNGREAIDLCVERPDIDIVLMDIGIPIINGFDATIEIKKLNSKLPIIAQTAYTTSEDRARINKAGCNDFLSKPIDYQLLVPMLEKYLS
jgi:PAS domain S-box-containing protein